MSFAETSLIAIATGLMVCVLILALVPFIPGTLLMWAIALVFGLLTQFARFTPVAAVAATAIMVAGVARDLWLPVLGVRTGGLSCLASAGAFVGGLLGTFFIPVPIVGTMAGGVLGALVVELAHRRQVRLAVRAGKTALKMQFVGYAIELISTFAIFVVYVVSLLTTR